MKQVTEHLKKTVAPWGEAWKNISRVLFLFLLITSATVGLQTLTSCDLLGTKDEDNLKGYWKSSYGDGFEIYVEGSKLKYKQYDDANKTISFEGEVANNPDLSASSGYIIIKITSAGSWGKTVGYYYGVHWKDFTGNTVKQSSAYKDGGQNNGMPTAEQAAQEYTVENGYYTYYGDYQRQ